ncbi:transposase [Chitinophaga filiformis]|uniref:IS66 family insertion sequence element accessory protein TnpA n=1 Tax=Chitinophaga filiformis TaxID=104663 RepID=UPI001F27DE0F|nr:transposase [Chitinophaga filiformis]MCF6401234.1 transposase [Chitinophaga filiformis]
MNRNILRRGKRDLEQIRYLLEQKVHENISLKDFCRMHEISEATYYNWKKRTVVKSEKIPTSFISSVIKNDPVEDMLFVEIEKPGGITIRIFRQMPAEFIKSLC